MLLIEEVLTKISVIWKGLSLEFFEHNMVVSMGHITCVPKKKKVIFLTPYFKGKKSQNVFLLLLYINLDLETWKYDTYLQEPELEKL